MRAHLQLLGALAIDERAAAIQSRRRPLALLALLAVAAGSGIDREQAMALLWPEQDEAHAASSLRQLLHGIRRAVGADAILAQGVRLALNPSRFSVDLWRFEDALAAGDMERAIANYAGPFLGAFHINGLHDFALWCDAVRDRLSHDFVVALRRRADEASRNADHLAASDWWRRINALQPLSSEHAIGFIKALVATGDREAALDFARAHEARVRIELDVEPDANLCELVAHLRQPSVARWPAPRRAHPAASVSFTPLSLPTS